MAVVLLLYDQVALLLFDLWQYSLSLQMHVVQHNTYLIDREWNGGRGGSWDPVI